MGKLFLVYGVHGSGKSFLSEIVAEDYGLELVKADAIEVTPEVSAMDPILREFHFIAISIAEFPIAINLTRRKDVIMDFAPLNTIPYIDYWANGDERLKGWLIHGYKSLIDEVKRVHIFFLPEKLEVVQQRIIKRNRGNVGEEANMDYIRFINNGLEKLSHELEDEGEEVVRITNTDLHSKLSRFLEVVNK